MNLLRFRYLRTKRVAALIVVFTLVSTLFSVTAYSFLGFYDGFSSYVGEDADVVAIYSKAGSTPFTGVVPLELADTAAQVNGVVAVSPEVLAPAMINGQSVFVRGVLPEELAKLNSIAIREGQALNLTDANSVIVGEGLAQRLDLNVGDDFLVLGVLSQRYVTLQVSGIFESASALNDEALAPLYIAQWLRGLGYSDASLLRVKIDSAQTSAARIYQQISNQTAPVSSPSDSSSPSPTPKSQLRRDLEALLPLAHANINISLIGVEDSQQFMQGYLGRYGVTKDTLLVLSVVVLLFACGTAACAVALFVKQHTGDIEVMRSIGVSACAMKADLAARMVAWALAASFLGAILSAGFINVFQRLGYLQVLSHAISFQLDPLVVAANFGLLSLLSALTVARMELKP
ncbi:MAG: ABC transporter permease [Candidatus Bathyarchaeota archaeon]|nr:ABC transporter permease [Candidatus Bathyarchaeota archaeon]